MVYTEEDLKTSSIDEAMSLLENTSYLTDQESQYFPEMVPIRENSRLQRNIVRLEDLVEYSYANGITEAGISLAQICEASKIDQNSVAFSVDEVSVLEDAEMEDTARLLIESGAEVYLAPINENDIAYILAESVIEAMIVSEEEGQEEYGDALFEAFISNDYETLLAEDFITESLSNKFASAGKSIESLKDRLSNTISQGARNSRNLAARKVSSLKTLGNKVRSSLGGGAKKLMGKMNQGVNYLTSELKKPFQNQV